MGWFLGLELGNQFFFERFTRIIMKNKTKLYSIHASSIGTFPSCSSVGLDILKHGTTFCCTICCSNRSQMLTVYFMNKEDICSLSRLSRTLSFRRGGSHGYISTRADIFHLRSDPCGGVGMLTIVLFSTAFTKFIMLPISDTKSHKVAKLRDMWG